MYMYSTCKNSCTHSEILLVYMYMCVLCKQNVIFTSGIVLMYSLVSVKSSIVFGLSYNLRLTSLNSSQIYMYEVTQKLVDTLSTLNSILTESASIRSVFAKKSINALATSLCFLDNATLILSTFMKNGPITIFWGSSTSTTDFSLRCLSINCLISILLCSSSLSCL